MDEEPTIEIKLRLSNTPQTKSNGKKSVNAILANFQCGLPSPIQQNNAEFSLFKSRKDKNQILLIEDTQNQVLYYDKRIPSHLTSQSSQLKKIGVFDPDSNEVTLIPVTYSFNMKSEKISSNSHHFADIDIDTENNMAKQQDLVDTFGSKFAVKNMNKQQRLRKTKDATIAAMDRMDTAQLITDKEETNTDAQSSVYQTKNVKKKNRKRKRSQMELDSASVMTDYNSLEHKQKYNNIFQHKFSKSPYCLFEFPYHSNVNKVSKVYVLKEIVPNHVWKGLKSERVWKAWMEWENGKENGRECGLTPTLFVQRCLLLEHRVRDKKGKKKYESWKQKLVLFDISVRFLRGINGGNKPYCVDKFFWQNLKAAYLEQFVNKMSADSVSARGNNGNKKIKYSMTRRSKMRIVGILLLVALNAAFWKISLDACEDIAKDLRIPFRVIIQIYRLLGCAKDEKIVEMKKRVVHRNPTTTIDGQWWNV